MKQLRDWLRAFTLRLARYLWNAFRAIPFNLVAFHGLSALGVSTLPANLIAYYTGAQVNFIGQDGDTFEDLFDKRKGRFTRWCAFMAGQSVGAGVNFSAAIWLHGQGFSSGWVNFLAMAASGIVNVAWVFLISHNPRLSKFFTKLAAHYSRRFPTMAVVFRRFLVASFGWVNLTSHKTTQEEGETDAV